MTASISDGKMLITVWDIFQYHYCPRKIYFLRTLEVPRNIRKKMEAGGSEHSREYRRSDERKTVFGIEEEKVQVIIRKQQMTYEDIGLTGIADIILHLKSGEFIPVEFKYTDYPRPQRQWVKQVIAYAVLIDNHFRTTVKTGILYFVEQNKRVDIDITDEDKRFLIRDVETIRELIFSERIPPKADDAKCRYCEVRKYCV